MPKDMFVELPNDHTLAGKHKEQLFDHLNRRGGIEMVPNFYGDYHYILWVLRLKYKEVFGKEPLLIKYLYGWMSLHGYSKKKKQFFLT